jgi:hypothetical protein
MALATGASLNHSRHWSSNQKKLAPRVCQFSNHSLLLLALEIGKLLDRRRFDVFTLGDERIGGTDNS